MKKEITSNACPDMIFVNANVYTPSNAKNSLNRFEAFSVKDGKFKETGQSKQIMERKCLSTKIVDLGGSTVLPGFIDSHAHILSTGLEEKILNLKGIQSPEEIANMVKEATNSVPSGKWITGRGWDQNLWSKKEFPSKEILDKVAPFNPVMLERVDGHAIWVNSKALEIAKITKETKDIEGGKIIRFPDGQPAGILLDNAISIIERVIPKPSPEEKKDDILRGVNKFLSYGITMVHDAGVDEETIKILKELVSGGKFQIRVYAMFLWNGEESKKFIQKSPVSNFNNKLWIKGVKFFLDGALGSRGAFLIQPYSDDPLNYGILTMKEKDFSEAVRFMVEKGYQPCVHAIGDGAVKIAVRVYKKLEEIFPSKDVRPRIEHLQVISPDDLQQIGNSRIIASMQPIHCTSDMYWAEQRLGSKRAEFAYAWRKIIDSGLIIAAGSDSPVESPNPLLGIFSAITRQDLKGYPEGGWYSQNKMTLSEAIITYTINGAKASFTENILGSIEPGKFADFVVLDKNIFEIPYSEIPSTRVLMTWVGGEMVYKYQSNL